MHWCLVCPLKGQFIRGNRRNVLSKKCIYTLLFTDRPSRTCYERGYQRCGGCSMNANAIEAHAERPQLKRRYKLLNFTQGQIYGLFFGHIGKLSMVALYFILTQWLSGQQIVTTIFG